MSPCSSPPQSATRIVRRGLSPRVLITRSASIIAADPVALSVAPVAHGRRVEVRAHDHHFVGEIAAGNFRNRIDAVRCAGASGKNVV